MGINKTVFAHYFISFYISHTAWKVSKYGVFSGRYFPAFGLNTERYGIRNISPYSVRMREDTDQKKLRIWTFFMQCYEPTIIVQGFKFAFAEFISKSSYSKPSFGGCSISPSNASSWSSSSPF